MSISVAMEGASLAGGTARCSGAREALAFVVLLYGLTQSAESLAGDSSSNVVKDIQPIVGGTPLALSFVPNKSQTSVPEFSTTDFSQRKPSAFSAPTPIGTDSEYPPQPLRATSAWQRLADYRSQGRVQLLTLWQSTRSTVSLQAGKRGGPSLQWSSRLMNRGGATRGLLDRFVASSLGATGIGSKLVARGGNVAPPIKTINLVPASKPQ